MAYVLATELYHEKEKKEMHLKMKGKELVMVVCEQGEDGI